MKKNIVLLCVLSFCIIIFICSCSPQNPKDTFIANVSALTDIENINISESSNEGNKKLVVDYTSDKDIDSIALDFQKIAGFFIEYAKSKSSDFDSLYISVKDSNDYLAYHFTMKTDGKGFYNDIRNGENYMYNFDSIDKITNVDMPPYRKN